MGASLSDDEGKNDQPIIDEQGQSNCTQGTQGTILPGSDITTTTQQKPSNMNNHKRKRDEIFDNSGDTEKINPQQSNSLIYSTEINVVEKKVKTNNYKDINLKLYYNKDLENMLPEKWGTQSGSLASSIKLLGSASLKNYEKSEILKKLAISSQQNSMKISQEDRANSLANSHKLNQVSQMLSALDEKYIKVCSVTYDSQDEQNRKYIKLSMSASAEVAELLVKQCKGNNQNIGQLQNNNEYKDILKNMSNKSYNDSQSTNVSKCTAVNFMGDEESDGEEDGDAFNEENVQDKLNEQGAVQNLKNSQKLGSFMEIEKSNNQGVQSGMIQSTNLCGSDQLQQFNE